LILLPEHLQHVQLRLLHNNLANHFLLNCDNHFVESQTCVFQDHALSNVDKKWSKYVLDSPLLINSLNKRHLSRQHASQLLVLVIVEASKPFFHPHLHSQLNPERCSDQSLPLKLSIPEQCILPMNHSDV
jgi:hypothetical protein